MLAELRSMTTTLTDEQKDNSLEMFMRITEGRMHPDTAKEVLEATSYNIRMAVEIVDGCDPVMAEPFRGNGAASSMESQHPGRNRNLHGASIDREQPEGEPQAREDNPIAIRNWTGVLDKLFKYRQRINFVRRTFGQTGPWLQMRYANNRRIDDKVGDPVRYT